jgi:hypothetical protein
MRTLTTNCSAANSSSNSSPCWDHLSGTDCTYTLGATSALSQLTSSDPTHHGRVSALQFDCTRLICAFTLGSTTNGVHQRRGSIKIWNLENLVDDNVHTGNTTFSTNNAHK